MPARTHTPKVFSWRAGELDGDGASEIVIGNDRGSTPEIKVYRVRGTQVTLLARDLTYEPSFTGGFA
jgi:hypothetical protein